MSQTKNPKPNIWESQTWERDQLFGVDSSIIGGATATMTDQLDEIAFSQAEWIVKDFLLPNGITFLSGTTGSGKSVFALDLALSVASGKRHFHGRGIELPDPSVPPKVLYIDGENSTISYARRTLAWRKRNPEIEWNHFAPQTFRRIPAVNLEMSEQAPLLNWMTADLVHHRHRIQLLVIDTLTAVSGMDNENDNAEMMKVIAEVQKMADALDCPALVLCHPSKEGEKHFRDNIRANKRVYESLAIRGGSAAAQRAHVIWGMIKEAEDELNANHDALLKPIKVRDGEVTWRTQRMKVEGVQFEHPKHPFGAPVMCGLERYERKPDGITNLERIALDLMKRECDDGDWHHMNEYGTISSGMEDALTLRSLKNNVGTQDFRVAAAVNGVTFSKRKQEGKRDAWFFRITQKESE